MELLLVERLPGPRPSFLRQCYDDEKSLRDEGNCCKVGELDIREYSGEVQRWRDQSYPLSPRRTRQDPELMKGT